MRQPIKPPPMPIMERNRGVVSRLWRSGRNGRLTLGVIAAVILLCLGATLALVMRPAPSPQGSAADIVITTPTARAQVEVTAGADAFPTPAEDAQPAPPLPDAPTPTIEPAVVPTTAPPPTAISGPQASLKAGNEFVNVRAGPGLSFDKVGELKPGQRVPVRGKSADGAWWQIILPDSAGGTGWVFAEYLDLSGDAASLPVID